MIHRVPHIPKALFTSPVLWCGEAKPGLEIDRLITVRRRDIENQIALA